MTARRPWPRKASPGIANPREPDLLVVRDVDGAVHGAHPALATTVTYLHSLVAPRGGVQMLQIGEFHDHAAVDGPGIDPASGLGTQGQSHAAVHGSEGVALALAETLEFTVDPPVDRLGVHAPPVPRQTERTVDRLRLELT